MSRALLILVALTGAAAAAVQADEPRGEETSRGSIGEGDLKERVGELVVQLDAGSRTARMQAERELLQLGPDVLPHFPAPELLPNVSVRETVRRIRLVLERRKARESLRPSRVTLEGTFGLDEIARRIAEQTGNRIELKADLERTFDVKYQGTDFWPAIDDLCQRAELEMRAGANVVALGSGNQSEPLQVAYSGPFRIAVLSADVRPLPGSPEERLLRCRLRLAIEPRLRALFLKFGAEDIAASVARIGMLRPFSPEARYELPMGQGEGQIDLQLDYRLPAPEAAAASLQGRLTMLVAAGEEQVEFGDLSRASGTAKRRGGVTVELGEVRFGGAAREGRTARVEVTVAYDTGGPAFESHRNWIYQNRAWLQAADGRRMEPRPDVTTRREADGAVTLVYDFEGLQHEPGEYRFAYVAPTLLVNAPVEMDLAKVQVRSRPHIRESGPQP